MGGGGGEGLVCLGMLVCGEGWWVCLGIRGGVGELVLVCLGVRGEVGELVIVFTVSHNVLDLWKDLAWDGIQVILKNVLDIIHII